MPVPDLSDLDSLVEEAMEQWRVPGLAIAVLHGNEVIKLQAYGTRDIENRLPVTTDTHFMICSLTKSFTAAGLGLLVDEHRLDWDTRVKDVLSEFELHDPLASEKLTVRDLLAHRSGLPRHDRIWSPPEERPRAQTLEVMRHLQLSQPLREKFQYCNLGYVVAGAVAEKISGQSWEAFTTERLLKPLGFTDFSFTTKALETSSDYASPHPKDGERIYRGRMWPLHAAPAGGINTSIANMAKWLGFLLSKGRVGGQQLLSETAIHEMMTPQIYIEDSEFSEIGAHHYGMGLTCEHYRGDRTVSHTGSMPGWGSMMSMLPNHGIGVVILTNRDPSAVRELLIYSIFDRLRSREPLNWLETFRVRRIKAQETEEAERHNREALTATVREPGLPAAAYVGKYEHAAYGELFMLEDHGVLRWRWRGLTGALLCRHGETFELKEDGDARFSPPLQITFQFGEDGVIDGLTCSLDAAVADINFRRTNDEVQPA